MTQLLFQLPEGSDGFDSARLGERLMMVVEDSRPLSIVQSGLSTQYKAYRSGIKPPTTGPTLADGSSNAVFIDASSEIYFVYAFYSSVRNTMSDVSPPSHITTAATPKQIVLSLFEQPRDDAVTNDIDTIVVGMQVGTSTGFLTLWGITTIDVPDFLFEAATITIDLSGVMLQSGFDLGQAGQYAAIPPATQFIVKYGERYWFGGQKKNYTISGASLLVSAATSSNVNSDSSSGAATVNVAAPSVFQVGDVIYIAQNTVREEWGIVTVVSGSSVTIDRNLTYTHTAAQADLVQRTWRGKAYAIMALTSGQFTDADLGKSVYANGRYLGEVWDISSDDHAWLDRDTGADIGATTDWSFRGHNDRLWPGSYHNNWIASDFGVTVSFAESINPSQFKILSPVLDGGDILRRMMASQDGVTLVLQSSIVTMTGGLEVNDPQPVFRTDFGISGAASSRSVCRDPNGGLFWIAANAFIRADTAGVVDLAAQLGLISFFQDPRWLASASLDGIPAIYSQKMNGYIIGNMTINGSESAQYWGLLSQQPQVGFWLFTGQIITSNIIEYPDSNGQMVLLAGDNRGRVKKLMDSSVMTDVRTSADTSTSYTTFWQEGFRSMPDGRPYSWPVARLLGLIIPDPTTIGADPAGITVRYYASNYPNRNPQDFEAGYNPTKILTSSAVLLRDISLVRKARRFHSLGLSWTSTTGYKAASSVGSARGIELTRWQIETAEEAE